MSARGFAADEFELIRLRKAQIALDETPRCPIITSRTLHDCLRAPEQCGYSCPHRHDWIGPEPKT